LPTPPAFNATIGGSRWNIAMPFDMKKTRIVWLPDGENNYEDTLFVLTESTNVTERQTDRHRMTAEAALA